MANTGKTRFTGTVVEVRKRGETVWAKFLCNKNAIEIDYGTKDENVTECLEDGVEDVTLGVAKFSDQTFEYVYTQASTNAGDIVMKNAHTATKDADQQIEIRLTMDNATDAEAIGTTTIVPFVVKGYKHKGEEGGKWISEVSMRQIGVPVETVAA